MLLNINNQLVPSLSMEAIRLFNDQKSYVIEMLKKISFLNITFNNVEVSDIEKILKNTPNYYGVASLNKQKNKTTAIKLIQSFLLELEKIYELLNTKQTKKIISEWTKRSSTIGKNVEIDTINGKIKGKAIKIDDNGALLIKNKGKTDKIIAGDIVHLL